MERFSTLVVHESRELLIAVRFVQYRCRRGGRGGGTYSFVAYLGHLTVDHTHLFRGAGGERRGRVALSKYIASVHGNPPLHLLFGWGFFSCNMWAKWCVRGKVKAVHPIDLLPDKKLVPLFDIRHALVCLSLPCTCMHAQTKMGPVKNTRRTYHTRVISHGRNQNIDFKVRVQNDEGARQRFQRGRNTNGSGVKAEARQIKNRE